MTDKTKKDPDDAYGRRFMLHVCKDGTVTYRDKVAREKVFNGRALPVFSVDTVEEAKAVQIRFCKLQYGSHPLMPGRPWFKLYSFSGELEDLDRVRDMFAQYYGEHKERETRREQERTAALVSKAARTRRPRKARKKCV